MSRTNDQIVGPYTAMSSALVLSPVRSQPSWESKVCVATKNSLMDAHPTNNMRMCRSLLRHCWPLTVLWRMIGSTMPTLVRWWRRVLFLPVLYPHPSFMQPQCSRVGATATSTPPPQRATCLHSRPLLLLLSQRARQVPSPALQYKHTPGNLDVHAVLRRPALHCQQLDDNDSNGWHRKPTVVITHAPPPPAEHVRP